MYVSVCACVRVFLLLQDFAFLDFLTKIGTLFLPKVVFSVFFLVIV